jgi:hypothetical protein
MVTQCSGKALTCIPLGSGFEAPREQFFAKYLLPSSKKIGTWAVHFLWPSTKKQGAECPVSTTHPTPSSAPLILDQVMSSLSVSNNANICWWYQNFFVTIRFCHSNMVYPKQVLWRSPFSILWRYFHFRHNFLGQIFTTCHLRRKMEISS